MGGVKANSDEVEVFFFEERGTNGNETEGVVGSGGGV